ncbi:MAG: GntR family transcriptional regulator [Lachnospiraceae bacterium]|nr:GntR family transcriptional regulator [Lachnospiraceae bacterium]
MAWKFDSDRPIYTQLTRQIQMRIVSGYYPPGGKLPSVRELAAEAAVNPNTMQKAFAELERFGLIITLRTNGRIVTEDTGMINETRRKLAGEYLEQFIAQMQELGFSRDEIITFIESTGREQHE